MNLAHSNGKPGALASTIKLDVRFAPFSMLKFEIKESHENIISRPVDLDGAGANCGAKGKFSRHPGPDFKSHAVC